MLHGPHRAPSLRVGDVVVTSWTDARIPWPRCKRLQGKGRPALLVDEELARAIRSESAAALRHWWGVGERAVWKWRRALGVGRTDNPGSARLIRAASQKGADEMKRKEWPAQAREQRRERAVAGNYAARLQPGYHGPRWTKPLQVAAPGGGSQQRAQVVVGFMVIPPPPWCCRRTSNRPPLAPDFHRWRGRGTMPAAGCGSGDLAVGWQRTEMSAGWGGANY